ncbi:MAG TPA: hypothetical protein VJW51_09335 [Candidatus Acidoferrales bacterium]|nr:hypothetical protein [Candidatus Acidoferrales bacterium]
MNIAKKSHRTSAWLFLCAAVLLAAGAAHAQEAEQAPAAPGTVPVGPVPRLVKFAGTLMDAAGQPRGGTVSVAFAVYAAEEGGTPLWLETQNVQADAQGHFTVLLGAASADGLPIELFSSGEPRWLGVKAHADGGAEQPRVLLVSVPYALKAADAETLGGLPASAFAMAEDAARGENSAGVSPPFAGGGSARLTGSGTAGFISMFLAPRQLGDSPIFSTGGNVGLGTTTPKSKLDVWGNIRISGRGNGIFFPDGSFQGTAAGSGGGGGTITAVNTPAGGGLMGGGSSGALSLSLLTGCGAGQILKWSGTAWACANDLVGGSGTVTSILTGPGLTGGPITTTGTLSLDTAFTDARYPRLGANNMFTGMTLFTGSVGIGTSSPTAPLEVAGNVRISGEGSTLTVGGNINVSGAGPGDGTLTVDQSALATAAKFICDPNSSAGCVPLELDVKDGQKALSLMNETSGTEVLNLDSRGNVSLSPEIQATTTAPSSSPIVSFNSFSLNSGTGNPDKITFGLNVTPDAATSNTAKPTAQFQVTTVTNNGTPTVAFSVNRQGGVSSTASSHPLNFDPNGGTAQVGNLVSLSSNGQSVSNAGTGQTVFGVVSSFSPATNEADVVYEGLTTLQLDNPSAAMPGDDIVTATGPTGTLIGHAVPPGTGGGAPVIATVVGPGSSSSNPNLVTAQLRNAMQIATGPTAGLPAVQISGVSPITSNQTSPGNFSIGVTSSPTFLGTTTTDGLAVNTNATVNGTIAAAGGTFSGLVIAPNFKGSFAGDGTNLINVNAVSLSGNPASSFASVVMPNFFLSPQTFSAPVTLNSTLNGSGNATFNVTAGAAITAASADPTTTAASFTSTAGGPAFQANCTAPPAVTTVPCFVVDAGGASPPALLLTDYLGNTTVAGTMTANNGFTAPSTGTATSTQNFASGSISSIASGYNPATGTAQSFTFSQAAVPVANPTGPTVIRYKWTFGDDTSEPTFTGAATDPQGDWIGNGFLDAKTGISVGLPTGCGNNQTTVFNTSTFPASWGCGNLPAGGGTVTSVSAANASITIGGTDAAPTVAVTSPFIAVAPGPGLSTGSPTVPLGGTVMLSSTGVLGVTAPAGGPISITAGQNPVVSLTGVIPVANGGTGSSTPNFVDLTSNQTVAGNKTLTGVTKADNISTANITLDPLSGSTALNFGGSNFNGFVYVYGTGASVTAPIFNAGTVNAGGSTANGTSVAASNSDANNSTVKAANMASAGGTAFAANNSGNATTATITNAGTGSNAIALQVIGNDTAAPAALISNPEGGPVLQIGTGGTPITQVVSTTITTPTLTIPGSGCTINTISVTAGVKPGDTASPAWDSGRMSSTSTVSMISVTSANTVAVKDCNLTSTPGTLPGATFAVTFVRK